MATNENYMLYHNICGQFKLFAPLSIFDVFINLTMDQQESDKVQIQTDALLRRNVISVKSGSDADWHMVVFMQGNWRTMQEDSSYCLKEGLSICGLDIYGLLKPHSRLIRMIQTPVSSITAGACWSG
jgi:hypothetical protein